MSFRQTNYYNNLPFGTLENSQPENKVGSIIIIGALSERDYAYHIGSPYDIEQTIKNYKAENLLFINLNDSDLELSSLKERIAEFTEKNEEVKVISAIHGSEILPFFGHELLADSSTMEVNLQTISSYLGGSLTISSYDYIKAVAEATGDKLKGFWQQSCQGNKLKDTLDTLLPKGCIAYTLSEGFVGQSGSFLRAMLHLMKQEEDLDFDKLLAVQMNELSAGEMINSHIANFNSDIFGFNPIKIVAGDHSYNLLDKADILLSKLNPEVIEEVSEIAVNYFSERNMIVSRHNEELYKFDDQEIYFNALGYADSVEEIKGQPIIGCNDEMLKKLASKDITTSVSKCFNGYGTEPYIMFAIRSVLGLGGSEVKENCELTTDEYAALQSCVAILGEDHPILQTEL